MAQKTATQPAKPGLGIDADLAKRLFRDMVLIRRFEEKAAEAYALGKIGGFLHLSIGEEAVAAGDLGPQRRRLCGSRPTGARPLYLQGSDPGE